jgi:hypothetical protein
MGMKPYNEQEFNRLCAEFLGYVNTTPTDPIFNIYENKNGFMVDGKHHILLEIMSMKFHSDWNWIMEVALKIRSIQPFETEYNDEKSIVPFVNFRSAVVVALMHVNKKVAVETIWEFLNWYNEQKS